MDTLKPEIENLCDIRIDKEGVWYYRGAEMYRTDIVEYLFRYLDQEKSGHYYIELSRSDRCRIEVEDTAFVVRSVEKKMTGNNAMDSILIQLSDGSREELCLESLSVSAENVLYCRVKANRFVARFSRKSHYQLLDDLEYDEKLEQYFLKLNGHRFYISENMRN